MANERALGISFMWAAQAWPQLSAIFGEQEARTLLGLTNNLIVFGGSKDVAFNKEISDLIGQVRVSRTSWQTGQMRGRQVSAEDIPILTPAEVRQLKERHALVLAENGAPIIARLHRCIDGKTGQRLLADQARLRAECRRRPTPRRHVRRPRHGRLVRGPSTRTQPRPRGRHLVTEQGPQPQQAAASPGDDRRVPGAWAAGGARLPGARHRPLRDRRTRRRPWAARGCCPAPGTRPPVSTPSFDEQLWEWLDRVVAWLNREYVWDVAGMIPACWPKHPHLVHEIAVLADLRRRAGHALTSDAMEEWHRYALPAFTERMRQRMKAHCEDKDHQPWPAQGRHTRHLTPNSAAARDQVFQADVATLAKTLQPPPPLPRAQLHLVDGVRVDPDTGEVLD